MMRNILILLILTISSFKCYPQKQKTELPRVKINTLAFTTHIYPNEDHDSDYTQYFENQYLMIGYRFSKRTYFNIGTALNSFHDRMFIIGFNRIWYQFNEKLSFEGNYTYAGEFFFPAFDNIEIRGYYIFFKKYTGLAFAPYIPWL